MKENLQVKLIKNQKFKIYLKIYLQNKCFINFWVRQLKLSKIGINDKIPIFIRKRNPLTSLDSFSLIDCVCWDYDLMLPLIHLSQSVIHKLNFLNHVILLIKFFSFVTLSLTIFFNFLIIVLMNEWWVLSYLS
jgi:hypothetical protein